MQLGLISDTHGTVPNAVHEALAGVDCILHAGDVGYIAARTRDAPVQRQLAVALAAQEHHLLYPLMWIVLAAAPALPPVFFTV